MTALIPISNATQSLPGLVVRAARMLADAETAAEGLEAREAAGFVYDTAKRTARLSCAKAAHDDLVAAAHAFSITTMVDAKQRPVHGGNLAADQRGLSFERLVILQLHCLLGQIRVEGFGQLR